MVFISKINGYSEEEVHALNFKKIFNNIIHCSKKYCMYHVKRIYTNATDDGRGKRQNIILY